MKKTNTPGADPLREKSFQLAIRMVRLHKFLTENKREFVMSKQLLRSGTNPGAMVREAANAESGMDFIHKLGIAQKETGETLYWLDLLHATGYLSKEEYESLHGDASEVMRIIRSSILTKKKNLGVKLGVVLALFAFSLTFLFY